ncbi:MAG: helix-turn-helix domain-containing protein [Oscillospiraceae bacterium]|nr:helix-turn-helix domain-containing protein [Oscillospiraceae bacterium]
MYKTVRQTSKLCGIPEYRLRQWIKQGRVPGWHSGNRFMVDIEELLALLKKESLSFLTDRGAQTAETAGK